MKLSNKILIGFLVFIFLYLTAVFAEVRLKGNPHLIDDSNSIAETVGVKDFSYLVLPELDQRMSVIGSEKASVEVRSISGDLLQKLNYNLSGDTLTFSKPSLEENQRIKITVYVPKGSFKGMTVTGSGVEIDSLEQEVLSVTQNSGWISVSGTNTINQLNIIASNEASFNISDLKLDLLKVELDDSRVTSDSTVQLLEGSMKSESFLYVESITEVRMKKDESSRLIFN